MSHYGVLRILRQYDQLAPSIVAGCSAGAVAGTLYAAGIDQVRIEQMAVDIVKAMGADVSLAVSLGLAALPERVKSTYGVITWQLGTLGVHQLWRSLAAADVGFEITGISGRSPVKAGQTDLMEQGAKDMLEHIQTLRETVQGRRVRLWK